MGKCSLKFIFIILTSLLHSSTAVEAFLGSLPPSENSVLDSGFRKLLMSFSGYVLYGDKPMCIEAISNELQPKLVLDEILVSKNHLFKTLSQWDLSSWDREYIFLFTNYANHQHLIIINKKAFIKTVNNNLSLFRYVLDPKMTAESLLTNLINDQEHFYDVIKNDQALLGILLGYGANNSIAHRFYELSSSEIKHTLPYFPYLHNQAKMRACKKEPFNSIGSWDISKHATYRIPCFSCDPNSAETQSLLATYENNRYVLIQAIEKEHFLESFLERIFTTTSGELKIPKVKYTSSLNFGDPNELIKKFAEIIWSEAQVDGKNHVNAFIRGMKDADQNKKMAFDGVATQRELLPLSMDIHDRQNLEQADSLYRKLSKSKKWIPLIDQNVLYKIIKKSQGTPASTKTKQVTFYYSFHTSSHDEVRVGTIEKGNLEAFIPGLAHAFIGMKRGEERMVYIHPRYAYGDRDPYPNKAILANILLVDFSDADQEIVLAPKQSIDSKQMWHLNSIGEEPSETNRRKKPQGTTKELLVQYDKLQEQLVYINGYNFWTSIKNFDIPCAVEELIKKIHALRSNDMNEEERIAFILEFKAHLFHKRYMAGEISIQPFLF